MTSTVKDRDVTGVAPKRLSTSQASSPNPKAGGSGNGVSANVGGHGNAQGAGTANNSAGNQPKLRQNS